MRISNGLLGPRALLRHTPSAKQVDELKANGVVELELNYAKGWKGSYDFLAQMPFLRGLELTDWFAESVEPIHCLRDLRHLHLESYCKTPVRFGCFPCLRRCYLEWRKGCESLFDLTAIEKLGINRLKLISSEPLRNLR
ncbi:MAG: hypothetical protein AAGG44_18520, partial [Planctomycetota bacterium]